MPVDLHTHSTASDGTRTPTQLVEAAAAAGLSAIAITDHDTIDGVAEGQIAGDRVGLEVISGLELSLQWDRGGMHLIALFVPLSRGPLQDRLQHLRSGRDQRNRHIIQRLNELAMEITIEEVEEVAGKGSVGRPHVAAVMVQKGQVPDQRTAFDEFLGKDRPAYVERPRLSPDEAIRLTIGSGAVPVLAHPHTLGIDRANEMADLLEWLREAGLVGLEAVYSSYQRHERYGYEDLAGRFGLLVSGGSDFHGDFKPGLELGIGYGDLAVPEPILERLRGRAG